MDRAKILDTVTRHMLWQGKPARDDNKSKFCRYQNEEGLKCAIGCLLPEDHPGMSFRGSVRALLTAYPDLGDHLDAHTEEDIRFLRSLQHIHDKYSVEEWQQKLADVEV